MLKGVTDSGAVRLTDMWKFKHHSLTVPTITATDRIVKATQDLTTAIDGQNKAPPDELEAIENLRALIYGSSAETPPTGTGTSLPPATTFLPKIETAPGHGSIITHLR